MPHECTTCGRQFDDGSKEMLSGCPNCGGNKFQFQPPGRSSDASEQAHAADADEPAHVADADEQPRAVDTDEQPRAADTDEQPRAADAHEPAATTEPSTDRAPSTPDQTTDRSTSATESADPLADPGTEGELDLPDDTAHAAETAGDDAGNGANRGVGVDADDRDASAEATPTESAEERYRDAQIDEFGDAETADDAGTENSAQRDARSTAVSPDEIEDARRRVADTEAASDDAGRGRGTPQGPQTETPSGADPDEFALSEALDSEADPVEKQPVAGSAPEREEPVADEDTDLKALREELNQQFESIKITAPGQYELNLMELYDRKEYIISLQEDGRYVIEMADDYGIDED